MSEFQEGQRWQNPDGLCMNIVKVTDTYIHYLTDQQEFGRQTVQHMAEWLEMGAIQKAGPQ